MTELTKDEHTVFNAVFHFTMERGETATEDDLNRFLGGRKLTMIRRALPRLKRRGLIEVASVRFYEKRWQLTDAGIKY